jgi:hypothetical protein
LVTFSVFASRSRRRQRLVGDVEAAAVRRQHHAVRHFDVVIDSRPPCSSRVDDVDVVAAALVWMTRAFRLPAGRCCARTPTNAVYRDERGGEE